MSLLIQRHQTRYQGVSQLSRLSFKPFEVSAEKLTAVAPDEMSGRDTLTEEPFPGKNGTLAVAVEG
ncbi:MAG TPA: hypothetical protein DDZ80_24400 [Cyanobacteria bacterium UBA8803]|nr:hypothetical protein [Cyanobacteria bacterium UBA9273]HBL61452.1 hypothetical protein [Cyanobacteria bacterium UBA8803]